MKKFTLSGITFFFTASFVNAQINKGTILLGGGISAGIGKSSSSVPAYSYENKFREVNIYPAIGLAVKQNIIVGIKGSYGYNKNEYSYPSLENKSRSYSAGVFLRRYLPLGKSFYLFGEAGASYYYSKIDQFSGIDSRDIHKQ